MNGPETHKRMAVGSSRVLIVDDQPENIQLLHHVLGAEHEVFMTTDSREAFGLCLRESPDLILLDVEMPHLGGFELCEQLKSCAETCEIPLIFITSHNSAEEETRGLTLGAVDFISKPINPLVVRARVNTHLSLKHLTDRLRQMAMIDELTQVPNRRRFDEQLELEWRSCMRHSHPLGLIAIDVDHFKAYNDHYGHTGGDAALRAVARVLKRSMQRSRDFVARYGGEEFMCIVPDSDLEATLRTAQYLCRSVEKEAVPHAASPIASVLTISAGVAACVPLQGASPQDLVRAADKNLYRAKAAGRGQALSERSSSVSSR